MPLMQSHADAISSLERSRTELATCLKRGPTNSVVVSLFNVAMQISGILDEVDTARLNGVPTQLLLNLQNQCQLAVELFNQKVNKAAALHDQNVPIYNRPGSLVLDDEHAARWLTELEAIHTAVYSMAEPMIVRQKVNRIEAAIAQPRQLAASVEIADTAVVWKYMPMRSFERTMSGAGIWLSSMESLRAWPEKQT